FGMGAPPNKSKDGKKKSKDKKDAAGGGGGEHKDDDHKSAARPVTIDCPKSALAEGTGLGDKGLPNCVHFFPEVITYQPENKKQIRNLEVKNKGDRSIMFKMKSTSPGVYRMRPIHFILRPAESKIIKLSYKGCPEGKGPNLKDRFTVVMAYPPGTETNIKAMWTQKAYVEKLADCTHRKYIKVHFDGYDVPDKKAVTPSKMAPPPPAPAPAAPAAAPAAPAAPAAAPQPGMPGWPGGMPGMPGMAPGGGGIVYVIYQGDQAGQQPGGSASPAGEKEEDDKDDKEGEEEEEEEEEDDKKKKK
ncbi:hypothetical protein PFISCL1PPCAC_4626, partial [Pristionchus fissidentatus]